MTRSATGMAPEGGALAVGGFNPVIVETIKRIFREQHFIALFAAFALRVIVVVAGDLIIGLQFNFPIGGKQCRDRP